MTFQPDCSRIHIHDMKNSKSDVLIRKKQLRDYPLHWHDCFEIELVLQGSAQHILNGTSYTLSVGDVYLLRPTDFHEIHLLEPVTAYNLMFQENILEEDMLNFILHTDENICCQLSPEEFNDLSSLMRIAVREFEGERPYRSSFIQNLLECIFISVIRPCGRAGDTRPVRDVPLQKILTYLHGHFRENPSMAEMAQMSGFNPCYFSTLFHRETGRTYKDYLSDLKLNYAHKLALASNLPVTEICFACGFNSLSHFMREYKAQFGCSPRSTRVSGA